LAPAAPSGGLWRVARARRHGQRRRAAEPAGDAARRPPAAEGLGARELDGPRLGRLPRPDAVTDRCAADRPRLGDLHHARGRIVTGLNGCKHFTGSAGSAVVHGAVGRLSLPRIGVQSAAFAVSITINGITSSEDVVVAHDGSVVMDLSLADVSVSSSEFTMIARSALAKIAQALRPAIR
jgi:hypothetical protein